MAYRALYRTYRPRTFEEVIGQSHITTILKNQVASGHIAHAYLFCGSRGTGKTSTARIFARAVNCLSPVNGEPCGTCDACARSARESCPDIVEMDAASNRGIENIRDLIESAQYMPLELQKRVFILDEAHMITSAAFNALLKTLEEPPSHIMFILATTEPQKLPATILSRCQRFDFHRLSIQDITQNLKNVLSKSGASIDDEGLSVIARAANGGMRDALSLADQCLSFCGDSVSGKDVYEVLGNMDQNFLFEISDAILRSDAKHALSLLDGIVRNGRDLTVFCSDLASHFRSLLLAKTCGPCSDLLECTDDVMHMYLKQSSNTSEVRLLTSSELILKTQREMTYIMTPRALLESMLIRLCRPEDRLVLENLEARVDKLEKQRSSFSPASETVSGPSADIPEKQAVIHPASVETACQEAPASEIRFSANDFGPMNPGPHAPENNPSSIPEGGSGGTPSLSDEDRNDPDILWNAVRNRLGHKNPLMGRMTERGMAQRLEENTLVIGFPHEAKTHLATLSMPAQIRLLNSILDELRPGTTISLITAAPSRVSQDKEEELKKTFGERLIIQE